MSLEWKPTDDGEDVAFMAEMLTFTACLRDYTLPTETPSTGASKLEWLRWILACYEREYPAIPWRAWVHPQRSDAFWMTIGSAASLVTYTEALQGADFAAGALRALRW